MHECIGPVTSRWHCYTSVLSDLMLLQRFQPLLWKFACILWNNGCDIDIPFMSKNSTDSLWVHCLHCLQKAASIMKGALIHGYWDTYLKDSLILCPFSKIVVGLHFGPVGSPAVGFGRDLQYKTRVSSCEKGLKPNQKMFGYPYTNVPFLFNPGVYFARPDNSLDWEHSKFCAAFITIHLKNIQLC